MRDIEIAAQQFADEVGIGMARVEQTDAVLQLVALGGSSAWAFSVQASKPLGPASAIAPSTSSTISASVWVRLSRGSRRDC